MLLVAHIPELIRAAQPADLSGDLHPGQATIDAEPFQLRMDPRDVKPKDLLPAGSRKEGIRVSGAGRPGHEALRRAIQPDQHMQDSVALDTPPFVLQAADRCRTDRVSVEAFMARLTSCATDLQVSFRLARCSSIAACSAAIPKSRSGF